MLHTEPRESQGGAIMLGRIILIMLQIVAAWFLPHPEILRPRSLQPGADQLQPTAQTRCDRAGLEQEPVQLLFRRGRRGGRR